MDAIDTLMSEHRLIEKVLTALGAFGQDAVRGTADDRAELSRFVTFFREFADNCHHGKEEGILFSTMIEHGFSAQGGPIAVMLHEHDQGRALIRTMAAHAEQAEPWSQADRSSIAHTTSAYGTLLRAHIFKEDTILYPMAEARLPKSALEEIAQRCANYETDHGAHKHCEFQSLGEELVARHAPGLTASSPMCAHACHSAPSA